MQSLDTSRQADEIHMDVLRRMTGSERLRIALNLSDLARKLTLTRIQRGHHRFSRRQLVLEFLRSVLSAEDYPTGLR